MKQINKPGFIFSVFQEGNLNNYKNHENTKKKLIENKIAHKEIEGVYIHKDGKRVAERSFYVEPTSFEESEIEHLKITVISLCTYFDQESYLQLDQDRTTYLNFLNGDRCKLGVFTATTLQDAKEHYEAFTYDYNTNLAYVCK